MFLLINYELMSFDIGDTFDLCLFLFKLIQKAFLLCVIKYSAFVKLKCEYPLQQNDY